MKTRKQKIQEIRTLAKTGADKLLPEHIEVFNRYNLASPIQPGTLPPGGFIVIVMEQGSEPKEMDAELAKLAPLPDGLKLIRILEDAEPNEDYHNILNLGTGKAPTIINL